MINNVINVFLLGPKGTFSSEALVSLRGNFRPIFVRSLPDVFKRVKRNAYGFVPVRNKNIGRILTIDYRKWRVMRRLRFPVHCALVTKSKIKFSEIRTLYVSGIVKKQCRDFIARHLKNARCIIVPHSSAEAFKKVVQHKGNTAAAIGSSSAAKIYFLRILRRNIQDDPKNWTEFVFFTARSRDSQNLKK